MLYATRNLERADIALLVIDAEQGITTQDSRIARLVEESGCACIVLANKWDNSPQHLKSDSKDAVKKFREILDAEWPFLDFAPLVAISAEKGMRGSLRLLGPKARSGSSSGVMAAMRFCATFT